MEKKLFKINWTSENPYQREIDMYFWSLAIIEAFDNGELSKEQVDKLTSIGFNWGYYRQQLIEKINCPMTQKNMKSVAA